MKFSLTNLDINNLIIQKNDNAGIISIWGDVGTGKTTMCFGAALSLLSKGKKVIFINTKSFFKLERFNQMKAAYPEFDIFNFLVYNPKTLHQQIKIIMNLEFLILKEINTLGNTNIGLIVLDTATTLRSIEMKSSEYNQKIQLALNSTLATLDNIVKKYNIPVIITNRSIILFDDSPEKSIERPSSAKSVDFWAKFSIKIERTQKIGFRTLKMEKHPENKLKKINVRLTNNGLE